ncbi:flowering time control protein FPA-like [Rutidosis leptorrhynchoides]|uniref:flowering time control protein FPA-like n=1 Tax=Rutidosis leptorrhynchoides TaxID=125765 RepID=UPI003A9A108A
MRPPFKSNSNQSLSNISSSSESTVNNNLWVGNLSADVTDSDLRNLFEKHGVVDSITCYPTRSYAFVNMRRPEDAKRAKDSLQGVVLRGGSLKIDFAKLARPCKSLWVSGISISTSEQDLEKEFLKFGKIEDFKFHRDKNTAYVDYARLEDATKALKMMHGKFKGGSMLRVDYLRSQAKKEQAPDAIKNFSDSPYHGPKRQQNFVPLEGQIGNGEQPSNVLVISYPPVVHVDEQMLHNAMILFGEIDNIRSFPSRQFSLVEFRSVEEAQLAKDGLQGRLFNDPRISVTFSTNDHHAIFNEPSNLSPQLDVYGHPVFANTFHARASPYGGPPDGFDPLHQGTWDVYDANQLQREPKRLRTDGNIPLRDRNDLGLLGPEPGYSGRFPTRGTEMGRPSSNYIWRGVIAKGGTTVCHARCVPIREWVGYDIPEVVNCSARTGLDMLAKHYTDAVGFDIVFFLPDCEEDFASYTEFVRYLGDRNRAGVAKFDDGTTLFLVPPSEFLTDVLNVHGPERLYGVVLKFPQHTSSATSAGPLSTQPQYIDKQQVPSQNEYNNIMPSGVPHDNLESNLKSTVPPTRNPPLPPSAHPSTISTSTPQSGLSLTPELIATLASLAKGKLNNGQQPPGPPVVGPVSTSVAPNDRPLRPWEYESEPSTLSGRLQQADNTFHVQPQILPQHQGYQSNMVNDSHFTNFPPIQDHSQSGHFAGPMQPSHQYIPNYPQDTQPGYGFEQKPDAGSVLQTGNLYGGNVYQPQNLVPAGPGNSVVQLPDMHQLQSALNVAGQQPSDFDANKNERYQSTLQFATNLLLQIHQQPPGTQPGHGAGSHQGGPHH